MSGLDGCKQAQFLLAALILMSGVSCAATHSTKGWELYSRQVNGEWQFSMLPGTNRLKSCEEITVHDSLHDIDSLKRALEKVDKSDSTVWIDEQWLAQVQGAAGCGLKIPSQNVVTEVSLLYQNLGLKLFIPERNL